MEAEHFEPGWRLGLGKNVSSPSQPAALTGSEDFPKRSGHMFFLLFGHARVHQRVDFVREGGSCSTSIACFAVGKLGQVCNIRT